MAINISVYSNANAATKTITFDFVGNVLASDNDTWTASNAANIEYYFLATTGARQDTNVVFSPKVMRSFSDLALDNPTQTSSDACQTDLNTNSTDDYATVKSMIVDYVYDYINGHAANVASSECVFQGPMKFV